jgi:hypothetical protein
MKLFNSNASTTKAKAKPRWKIECRYVYGWDNAGWECDTADGKVQIAELFNCEEAANLAIDEFIVDCQEAVLAGDMEAAPLRETYRAVMVCGRPGPHNNKNFHAVAKPETIAVYVTNRYRQNRY